MTVKISKPAINVREELADLKKPTGIAGEAMLRAETPQEQFNLIGAGRRNLIVNGDFSVSQRGDFTSATTISTNGTYFLDRMLSYAGNVTGNVQDMNGSIKHTATNSTVGYLGLEQRIEDYSRLAGETITVSAEVKSNTPFAQIMINDSAYKDGVHHSGGGDWEKLSHTFTVKANPSRLYIQVWIANTATSLNANISSGEYIEVRNLQVERGRIATPFEYRSYGEELALCQRYYWEAVAPSQGTLGRMSYIASSTSGLELLPMYPVPMRATPVVSLTNPTGGWYAYRFSGAGGGHAMQSNLGGTSLTSFSGGHMWWYIASGSPFTIGFAGRVVAISSSGAFKFDAEL